MSNEVAVALIIGVLLPPVVSFMKQTGLGKWWNTMIVVLVCAIAGTFTVWGTGGFNNFQWETLVGVIATVFVASQAAYFAYWKGTKVEASINEWSSFITAPTPVPVKKAAKKK